MTDSVGGFDSLPMAGSRLIDEKFPVPYFTGFIDVDFVSERKTSLARNSGEKKGPGSGL
jgi:hypothetical protein